MTGAQPYLIQQLVKTQLSVTGIILQGSHGAL